MVAAAT